MTQAETTLNLRCRDRRWSAAPPPVQEFTAGARLRDESCDPIHLLVLYGANDDNRLPSYGCRFRDGRLPRPQGPPTADPETWSLKRGGERRRRTAAVTAAAAAVPMLLAPVAAHAAGAGPSAPSDGDAASAMAALNRSSVQFQRVLSHTALRLDVSVEDDHGVGHSHPPMTGKPFLIPGTIMTVTGSIFMTIGAVVTAIFTSGYSIIYPFYSFYYGSYFAPFFATGGTMLGVGIPLMISGQVMEAKRNEWFDKRGLPRVSVEMSPSRSGWGGQLSLRF